MPSVAATITGISRWDHTRCICPNTTSTKDHDSFLDYSVADTSETRSNSIYEIRYNWWNHRLRLH
jgi:hypothetical protein